MLNMIHGTFQMHSSRPRLAYMMKSDNPYMMKSEPAFVMKQESQVYKRNELSPKAIQILSSLPPTHPHD